jgi:hypothetical protein
MGIPKIEEYKSDEELYFAAWIDELKECNIVLDSFYEKIKFDLSGPIRYPILKTLKTKQKIETYSLMDGHYYTCDFAVKWNPEYKEILFRFINDPRSQSKPPFFASLSKKDDCPYTFFETKGAFDYNNMTRLFMINQKWIYSVYGVYIHLIKIPDIFKKTFTPLKYKFTKSGRQLRKINYKVISIEEWMTSL